MRIAYGLLTEGGNNVLHNPAPSIEGGITLPYLEGIAKLRYSLTVVAELLHCQYSGDRQGHHTHESLLLIEMANKCCSDYNLNKDDTGPGVFLVKQLAKQYGVTSLINITSDRTMQWIIPANLRQSEEVRLFVFFSTVNLLTIF